MIGKGSLSRDSGSPATEEVIKDMVWARLPLGLVGLSFPNGYFLSKWQGLP